MDADQQGMQAYVRQQLAQSGGLRVPPATRMDSPQFLEEPDTGTEQGVPPAPPINAMDQANNARHSVLLDQLGAIEDNYKAMPPGPARDAMFNQMMAINAQLSALNAQPTGAIAGLQRRVDMAKASDQDVATIQAAMQQRQNAPRKPLPPPAPGGLPGTGDLP